MSYWLFNYTEVDFSYASSFRFPAFLETITDLVLTFLTSLHSPIKSIYILAEINKIFEIIPLTRYIICFRIFILICVW